MSEFQAVEEWVGALMAKISPSERAKVARAVGVQLRKSQQERIAQQKNPDGTPYQPRARFSERQKKNLRGKSGRIKAKAMFAKLRTARFMKVQADQDAVSAGFGGRAAVIGRRHQFGSRRRHKGRVFETPARELLGLTDEDLDRVRDALLQHLTD